YNSCIATPRATPCKVKSEYPKGGVILPTATLTRKIAQNHKGSNPSPVTIGLYRGTSKIMTAIWSMNMHRTKPSPINNTNMRAGDQSKPITDFTRLVVTPLMLRIWLNETEHTIITMIMEVVHAVAFSTSKSLRESRLANVQHSTIATTQPTAA